MLYDFFKLHNKELKDFSYAKSFYKAVEKDFKNNNDISYFSNFLERLYNIQGAENFEKITGFSYDLISKKINNIDDLLSMLYVFIKLKGKKNTAQETGLSVPTINNVFIKNKNITLSTLEKLFNLFKISINYSPKFVTNID